MNQEYNLAGKTLVVEKVKELKGKKSEYIRQVVKTAQNNKRIDESARYSIEAIPGTVERDDTRRDSQTIVLKAVVVGRDNANPRFEINGVPRMCGYHTGDIKEDLIADLQDMMGNQTPFTPEFTGDNNWSRGGSLFHEDDIVSVVYLCSDETYVTALMSVTGVGSDSLTGLVIDILYANKGFDDRDTGNCLMSLPYAQAVPVQVVLYDNLTQMDSLQLEVVNTTRHRRTFGVDSSPKGSTYTEEGVEHNYIEGDSYVSVSVSGDTKTATVMFWFQNAWWVLNDIPGYARYDEILIESLPDVFSIYQAENHVSAAGYDWFRQVIAEHISAVYYFVRGAIYGYGQNGSVDMTQPPGQRAQGDAFIIDANGIMEISSGYARDLNVRGVLNLYDNTGTGAAAEIQHPALTTVPEQGGDEIGKTLPLTSVWNIKEFYNNSNIPANICLNDISSASFGGTDLNAVCRLTDISAAAVPAASNTETNIENFRVLMYVVIPPFVSSVTFTVTGSATRYTFFNKSSGGHEYRAVYGIAYAPRDATILPEYTVVVQPQARLASYGGFPDHNINCSFTLGPGSWKIVTIDYPLPPGGSTSTIPFPGSLTCSNSAVLFISTSLNSLGFWVSNSSGLWSNLGRSIYYSKTTQILSLTRNGITFSPAIFYSSTTILKNYSSFYGKTDDVSAEVSKYYYEDSSGSNPVLGSNVSQYFPYQDSSLTLLYYEQFEVGIDRIYRIEPLNVLINGVQYVAAYFTRQVNSITIYTSTGESFSFADYIWMTLADGTTMPTIRITGSKAGVEMMGNYPKEDMVYNSGSPDRVWLTGYFADVRSHSTRETKDKVSDYERLALPILNKTKIVRFVFKSDKKKTPHIGFIADDTDSDLSGEKHDSFITNHVAAMCIKAIQELSAEVERLKAERQNN